MHLLRVESGVATADTAAGSAHYRLAETALNIVSPKDAASVRVARAAATSNLKREAKVQQNCHSDKRRAHNSLRQGRHGYFTKLGDADIQLDEAALADHEPTECDGGKHCGSLRHGHCPIAQEHCGLVLDQEYHVLAQKYSDQLQHPLWRTHSQTAFLHDADTEAKSQSGGGQRRRRVRIPAEVSGFDLQSTQVEEGVFGQLPITRGIDFQSLRDQKAT